MPADPSADLLTADERRSLRSWADGTASASDRFILSAALVRLAPLIWAVGPVVEESIRERWIMDVGPKPAPNEDPWELSLTCGIIRTVAAASKGVVR